MSIGPILAGIVLCLVFSAFFSAAEMAFSSCSRLRLESEAENGRANAKTALKITDRFEDALGAILIGNNLVNIAASSLSSVLVLVLTGSAANAWIATLAITVLVVIFGETIPKITAKKNANRFSIASAPFVRFFIILFTPLVRLVVFLTDLLTRGIRNRSGEDANEEHIEELHSIIETAEDEGVLDSDRTELVQAAIDFADISAYEIMTARVDVEFIDAEDSPEEIMEQVADSPYTRFPVYEDSVDNIIGTLHLNHFLKAVTEDPAPDLKSLLLPPCYVYKTMKLPQVLSRLRSSRQHLAVVTDEYSGVLGVVSMEDVLEQIVGDIWDESDTVEEEVVKRGDSEYEVDGDMIMEDLLELPGIRSEIPEYESDTVGGWVIERLDRFPRGGESFALGKLRVKVLKVDGLRVEKVLVKLEPAGKAGRAGKKKEGKE